MGRFSSRPLKVDEESGSNILQSEHSEGVRKIAFGGVACTNHLPRFVRFTWNRRQNMLLRVVPCDFGGEYCHWSLAAGHSLLLMAVARKA